MKKIFFIILISCSLAYGAQPTTIHVKLPALPMADVITYRCPENSRSLNWRVAFLSGAFKNFRVHQSEKGKLSAVRQTGHALTIMQKKDIAMTQELRSTFHNVRSIIYNAALKEGQDAFTQASWQVYEDKSVVQLWKEEQTDPEVAKK